MTLVQFMEHHGIPAQADFSSFDRTVLERSMQKCNMNRYPEIVGDPNGERCSGLVMCSCGWNYFQHPLDWRFLEYRDKAYLHILCDGRRVKL